MFYEYLDQFRLLLSMRNKEICGQAHFNDRGDRTQPIAIRCTVQLLNGTHDESSRGNALKGSADSFPDETEPACSPSNSNS